MRKYFSLVLFAHSIFALPFAIIGFFLATTVNSADFSAIKFILMLLCMVFARNAAMAFNRYIDRGIDILNPRTANRDIPSGRVSPNQALTFTIVNSICFIMATYFINSLCFYLSPVALLVILGYSYTKRFTALCHLVLGLGLGLAPLGAYLVITGAFDIVPVFYSLAVIFWVSGFDIIYALQDEEFDKEENLHSIPAFFGKKKALRISELLHLLSAIFVILPAFYIELGWLYYIGVVFYVSLLVYQHLIISPTDLRRVNRAFMTTNGIASVIFAIFFLLDIWI
ncbi:UbiA-like polyprenyltransferase [Albibacterium indicum]|uniref:UbiA-like polyprenyltransferase n=1 Tax=Albibacterium indicum TaxID=2292082 RepID=UPI000E471A24|nr:UbiA-like polyprenyltransferase [Pedobacter indicus]